MIRATFDPSVWSFMGVEVPATAPGVSRYLADGWRIVDVRLDGADVTVDIVKNPNLLGPSEVPNG